MSKTDYLEAELLKWCTGQANALDDAVITPWIGIFLVMPGEAGGGTEVSGGAYARVSAAGKFGSPTGGQIANNAAIQFPTPTADWAPSSGQAQGYGLFTAQTGGQLLRYQAFTSNGTPAPRTILTGDAPSFAVGKLILTED